LSGYAKINEGKNNKGVLNMFNALCKVLLLDIFELWYLYYYFFSPANVGKGKRKEC
jgi:hypothetical protein